VVAPGDVDAVDSFIAGMKQAFHEHEQRGLKPPLERRKLRTILNGCGKRGSPSFLVRVDTRLMEAGIYTEPRVTDSGLRLDDWVLLSTGPFPPDSTLFPRESDLQRFVQACLGSGVFRNLELYRGRGNGSGREFRLPSGQRIDLLCQERTRTGHGALVVIELKREHERGTVDQVMGYIDELKKLFPARAVKSIIVSGREDQVASVRLRQVTGYDIRWLCYQVRFDELARSA
jgi:hypothetical protein